MSTEDEYNHHPEVKRLAGFGFEVVLKNYLEQLPTVSRVINFAGGYKAKELDPTRPDFKVVLTDGSEVFIDAKYDADNTGNVVVRHKQLEGYLKHAEKAKAFFFVVAGYPSALSYRACSAHAFGNMIVSRKIVTQEGPALVTTYTGEPTIEEMLLAIVQCTALDGVA